MFGYTHTEPQDGETLHTITTKYGSCQGASKEAAMEKARNLVRVNQNREQQERYLSRMLQDRSLGQIRTAG